MSLGVGTPDRDAREEHTGLVRGRKIRSVLPYSRVKGFPTLGLDGWGGVGVTAGVTVRVSSIQEVTELSRFLLCRPPPSVLFLPFFFLSPCPVPRRGVGQVFASRPLLRRRHVRFFHQMSDTNNINDTEIDGLRPVRSRQGDTWFPTHSAPPKYTTCEPMVSGPSFRRTSLNPPVQHRLTTLSSHTTPTPRRRVVETLESVH